jgi:hypothetical protein
MIEGSGADTMDGEIQTAHADAMPTVRYPQRLRPRRDTAAGGAPTEGLLARVNAATVERVAESGNNPRLDQTGHALTPA